MYCTHKYFNAKIFVLLEFVKRYLDDYKVPMTCQVCVQKRGYGIMVYFNIKLKCTSLRENANRNLTLVRLATFVETNSFYQIEEYVDFTLLWHFFYRVIAKKDLLWDIQGHFLNMHEIL